MEWKEWNWGKGNDTIKRKEKYGKENGTGEEMKWAKGK